MIAPPTRPPSIVEGLGGGGEGPTVEYGPAQKEHHRGSEDADRRQPEEVVSGVPVRRVSLRGDASECRSDRIGHRMNRHQLGAESVRGDHGGRRHARRRGDEVSKEESADDAEHRDERELEASTDAVVPNTT